MSEDKKAKSVEEMGFLRPVFTDIDWMEKSWAWFDKTAPHKEQARLFLKEVFGIEKMRVTGGKLKVAREVANVLPLEILEMIKENPEQATRLLEKLGKITPKK